MSAKARRIEQRARAAWLRIAGRRPRVIIRRFIGTVRPTAHERRIFRAACLAVVTLHRARELAARMAVIARVRSLSEAELLAEVHAARAQAILRRIS